MSHVSCEMESGWTYAKKALSFAKLTSDRDDEGGAPAGAGLCSRRTPTNRGVEPDSRGR